MNIGIIGSGHVGTALATGFAEKGHRVTLGSRDPSQERVRQWAAEDPERRHVASDRDAALECDIVVMAVPGRALLETLDMIGRDAFAAKIVIDATNPFGTDAKGHAMDVYGDNDSGAEMLQRELRDASVVKAFNEINFNVMAHPEKSAIHEMRIAGDNEAAKERVTELLESFGWQVHDLGPLSAARELEHAVIGRYS